MLSESDEIWRPIFMEIFPGRYYRGRMWLEEAEARAASMAPGTQRSKLWKREYALRKGQLTHTLGIFAMPADMEIGRPFGLHW